MNCQDFSQLLHAYLDRELDLVHSLEAEQHLKDCPACAARYEQQQALRKVIASRSLYFEAPADLRQRVRATVLQASGVTPQRTSTNAQIDRARPFSLSSPGGEGRGEEDSFSSTTRRPSLLSWLRFWWLAPVGLAALLFLILWVRPSPDTRLAQEIVSAHTRSLMGEHLTDVASTSQHTVKPWFNGKVTSSPPVFDLTAQGYPLVGGRLDVLDEQPVAALVYKRGNHPINLFLWPSSRSGTGAERFLTQRGYNLVHCTLAGMNCWAISDVNRADLQQFIQLLREHVLLTESQ